MTNLKYDYRTAVSLLAYAVRYRPRTQKLFIL